jgi:hypothetical protein
VSSEVVAFNDDDDVVWCLWVGGWPCRRNIELINRVGWWVDLLENTVDIIIEAGANQQCRTPISFILAAAPTTQSCEAD